MLGFTKDLFKSLKRVKQHALYHPQNIVLLLQARRAGESSCEESLKAAMSWLCRAQDVTRCGGVAAGYSFRNGWEAAYPETTGYIIETFYDFAKFSNQAEYRSRAKTMAEWLLSIQLPSGAFQGGPIDVKPQPVVFNTGMILFGLVRAFREECDHRFIDAAVKAGNWLLETQHSDGAWRKYTYKEKVHSYKSRVAWALLELWKIANSDKYRVAAIENLNWVLLQQQNNGFFKYMAFGNEAPYTHTIAYTIRGLLESGLILENEQMINAAIKTAERLFRFYEINKCFPGQFNDMWEPQGNYECVTGSAQFSIIWQRIYRITGDARYLNAALKMNDRLVVSQMAMNRENEIKGAMPGSTPLWGGYMPYYFPNWAAKFFCDAFLSQSENLRKLSVI